MSLCFLMGLSDCLEVFMRHYESSCVLVGPYVSLWILMGPYRSLCVLIGP